MPQVLLVNPSPRKGSTRAKAQPKRKPTMAKKARSAAQKAATRKLIAFNRAKSRKSRPARSAPKRSAHRAARAAPAPKKKKSRGTTARRGPGGWPITSTTAASRAGRALRHRRPNPISGVGAFVKTTLMPSVVGGAGALALDVAVAMLPLPPTMKTGPMAPLVKAAGAVGIGMLAGQFLGRRTGEQVAAGALTVTVYNVARQMLAKASGGRIPGLGEYVGEYVSEYVGEPPQLGYESSGGQVGFDESELSGYETGVYR